ncbi:MAG: FAD-binding oxidoreductase [Parazoarcus communis]
MSQNHKVIFRFADGASRAIDVGDDQNVLDVALAADVPLMHQCRSGSCSSCVAHLVDGRAATRAGASSTLLASEYAAGQRLLCVTQAQGDCTFELPYGSEEGGVVPTEAHAFVNAVEPIASNVVKLSLELADGQWLSFKPGQFVQVEVPGVGQLRSYSPVSTEADLPQLDLLIRLLPEGVMSSWLSKQAKVDDVVKLKGPYGAFFLREKRRAPHIFVAGGTGLAPVLSMIDRIRQLGGRKPPMLLSFGCATSDALFYLDELELRRQWLPGLDVRICVDREPGSCYHNGSPVSALRAEDVSDPDTVAYLCGPQGMIDAATARLIELGVAPGNVFSEQFVPSN